MKKFINWLKSTKSDFALFIIFLILLNAVSYNAYVRIDLTNAKSYSLSKESKNLVKNLEQPLSVRVFFDDNLPSPYNSVSQYVKDILVEYKGAGNKNFSVSYMDMSKDENTELARDLGLRQIQLQEVKNNEVGFKQSFMGIAITYGDNIEVINPITSTDGFEFNLTSKMSKMISMADTLSGLKNGEKISLTLYYSDILNSLGIAGAEQTETFVKEAFGKVNSQNQNRLELEIVNPSSDEADKLSKKYGIQIIQYKDGSGNRAKAAIGLVLEKDEKFYALPLQIQQTFFSYQVTGLETLADDIVDGLESLLSKVTQIGYITGHEELSRTDENGAKNFDSIISESYELVELDLKTQPIPAGMNSIIINGPKTDFEEIELYKIDQFIMKGGNVLFFVDSMVENQMAAYTGGDQFTPNTINLDTLLQKYGVNRNFDMVFDKNCYVNQSSTYGKLNLYWAPVLQKNQLLKHPVTQNLGYVIMLQNGSLDVSAAEENPDVKVSVLAKSSEESWTKDSGIMLNPMRLNPPSDVSQLNSYNLAILLDGKFESAFDKAPEIIQTDADGNEIEMPQGDLTTSNHISQSVLPGKIFVTASSSVTTRQVIDESGTTPIAMFMMNIVDYLNGKEELCEMRTKGLSVDTLTIKSQGAANFWKYFNEYGLVIILILAGLFVWKARSKRRREINKQYNPNDTRTISKK